MSTPKIGELVEKTILENTPGMAVLTKDDPLQFIADTIGHEVKEEETLIKLATLVMLSAYTPNPVNMALEGPQSEGKTYPLVKVAKLFPKADVLKLADMTPKTLVRERGFLVDKITGESLEGEKQDIIAALNSLGTNKEDQEKRKKIKAELSDLYDRGINVVDLQGKIIIFLESPGTQTFKTLRPILSRDDWEIEYKFVDRPYTNGPLVTMETRLRGWPVIIYATADEPKGDLWKQIRSRFIIVSPTMTPSKYRSANELRARKEATIHIPGLTDNGNKLMDQCQSYVKMVKNELYSHFHEVSKREGYDPENVKLTLNPLSEKLVATFPADEGQNMRDFNDFMALMQASCYLNLFNRPCFNIDNWPLWLVSGWDLKNILEIFDKYHILIRGSEVPIRFYDEILSQIDDIEKVDSVEGDPGFTLKTIKDAMAKEDIKYSDKYIRNHFLEPLEDLGLLNVSKSKADKRAYIYSPIGSEIGEIVEGTISKLKYDFDDLKEALEGVSNKRFQGVKGYINSPYLLNTKTMDPDPENKVYRASNNIKNCLSNIDLNSNPNYELIYHDHFRIHYILKQGEKPIGKTKPPESGKKEDGTISSILKEKELQRELLEDRLNELSSKASIGNEKANDDIGPVQYQLDKLNYTIETIHGLKTHIKHKPNETKIDNITRTITSKCGIDEPKVKKVVKELEKEKILKTSEDGSYYLEGME